VHAFVDDYVVNQHKDPSYICTTVNDWNLMQIVQNLYPKQRKKTFTLFFVKKKKHTLFSIFRRLPLFIFMINRLTNEYNNSFNFSTVTSISKLICSSKFIESFWNSKKLSFHYISCKDSLLTLIIKHIWLFRLSICVWIRIPWCLYPTSNDCVLRKYMLNFDFII
jgi:hypothetical protein